MPNNIAIEMNVDVKSGLSAMYPTSYAIGLPKDSRVLQGLSLAPEITKEIEGVWNTRCNLVLSSQAIPQQRAALEKMINAGFSYNVFTDCPVTQTVGSLCYQEPGFVGAETPQWNDDRTILTFVSTRYPDNLIPLLLIGLCRHLEILPASYAGVIARATGVEDVFNAALDAMLRYDQHQARLVTEQQNSR